MVPRLSKSNTIDTYQLMYVYVRYIHCIHKRRQTQSELLALTVDSQRDGSFQEEIQDLIKLYYILS